MSSATITGAFTGAHWLLSTLAKRTHRFTPCGRASHRYQDMGAFWNGLNVGMIKLERFQERVYANAVETVWGKRDAVALTCEKDFFSRVLQKWQHC